MAGSLSFGHDIFRRLSAIREFAYKEEMHPQITPITQRGFQ